MFCNVCFVLYFSLCISVGKFLSAYLQVSWFFLRLYQLYWWPLDGIFISYCVWFCFLISSISFDSFLALSSNYLCYPSGLTFCLIIFIKSFNTLIVLILNSLSDNASICVIPEPWSHDYFASLDCVFLSFCEFLELLLKFGITGAEIKKKKGP